MRSRLGGHTRLVAVRFGLVECSVYFKSESILTEDDIFVTYWRASVASETLTGVTQSKIGDVSSFIGERAKLARHSQG